jgi:hypothetical protein
MVCEGIGKHMVTLTHLFIGDDLLVIITGGDEHIGGVSLLENNSFSTISKKNHKDTVISKMLAPIIYDTLKRDVLVVCGIHIDDATKEDIDILINNAQKCVEEFLKEI